MHLPTVAVALALASVGLSDPIRNESPDDTTVSLDIVEIERGPETPEKRAVVTDGEDEEEKADVPLTENDEEGPNDPEGIIIIEDTELQGEGDGEGDFRGKSRHRIGGWRHRGRYRHHRFPNKMEDEQEQEEDGDVGGVHGWERIRGGDGHRKYHHHHNWKGKRPYRVNEEQDQDQDIRTDDVEEEQENQVRVDEDPDIDSDNDTKTDEVDEQQEPEQEDKDPEEGRKHHFHSKRAASCSICCAHRSTAGICGSCASTCGLTLPAPAPAPAPGPAVDPGPEVVIIGNGGSGGGGGAGGYGSGYGGVATTETMSQASRLDLLFQRPRFNLAVQRPRFDSRHSVLARGPLRKIGVGHCTSVWANPYPVFHDDADEEINRADFEQVKRNIQDVVIKKHDGGRDRSPTVDWAIQKRIERALETLERDNLRIHTHRWNLPWCIEFLHAQDSFSWAPILAQMPAGSRSCRALILERIPPFPEIIRKVLIGKYCPRLLQNAALDDVDNEDCLIRPYLGYRGGRPCQQGGNFSLRDLPLYLDQMEELGLDQFHYANAMAEALAFLHWKAQVDGLGVEFVLAPNRTNPPNQGNGSFLGDHTLWMLDFECCKPILTTAEGVDKAVDAFFMNDPYFPRPGLPGTVDDVLWRLFANTYLGSSLDLFREDELKPNNYNFKM
ncbi:calcineurin-like phosphoesterase [Ophiocordyceps camponoti-floridani]|uniref:Calcineurin-like phosphoesterase n=1 Tax=Ophiocordyceps camponoti-floridani TaxID=2030778 RepID=A0A8H4Q0I9_9HYPO|nr:calcineurin-like phosphoesterase [Ophiocordyceps camponoti-floridani]